MEKPLSSVSSGFLNAHMWPNWHIPITFWIINEFENWFSSMLLWSNFYLLIFLGASHRILWKNKKAVYRLQIPALVPGIFKFEKCLKYANEMTDDVIHSTQYHIICVNRAILANFETWQANSSIENTPKAIKHFVAMTTHSFPVSTHLISICKWFSGWNTLSEATNLS